MPGISSGEGQGPKLGCGTGPRDPPGIAPSPWSDPTPVALRSHHTILYAGLGGASSARCDEQPGAGVDLKRVQRERGPVQLGCPAPAHPASRALHCLRGGTRDMPCPDFDACPRAAVALGSGRNREDSQSLSHLRGGQDSNRTQ